MENITLTGGGGFTDTLLVPVALENSGDAVEFEEADELVYNEHGIRIGYVGKFSYGYTVKWRYTLVNESDVDVAVCLSGYAVNGEDKSSIYTSAYFNDSNIGAGQMTYMELATMEEPDKGDVLTFYIDIYDFGEEELLYSGTEKITLVVE